VRRENVEDPFERVAGSRATLKEPQIPKFSVRSLAVLSDVHANIHALRAVLAELDRDPVDLVVFSGDITWGSFPRQTVDEIRALRDRTSVALVRGNADRAVLELADDLRPAQTPRESWMLAQHRPDDVDFLREVAFQVDVEVAGVGVVRICHGSPRADFETLTPETPVSRLAAACVDVDADILLTGHTHLQFVRQLPGLPRVTRHLNPGSVGLPYGVDSPGARWVRIGGGAANGLALQVTPYDLTAHVDAMRSTDDPRRGDIEAMLRTPPTLAEIVEHAESRVFSD
jgi:putative phosphoesterase